MMREIEIADYSLLLNRVTVNRWLDGKIRDQ